MCKDSLSSSRATGVIHSLQQLQTRDDCNARFFMMVAVHTPTNLAVGAVWGERSFGVGKGSATIVAMHDVFVHPMWAAREELHIGSTLFVKFVASMLPDCAHGSDIKFIVNRLVLPFTSQYFDHVFNVAQHHFRSDVGLKVALFSFEGVNSLVITSNHEKVAPTPFINVDVVSQGSGFDAASASDQGEWMNADTSIADPKNGSHNDEVWLQMRNLPTLLSSCDWDPKEHPPWCDGLKGKMGDLRVELTVFDSLETAFTKSLCRWLKHVVRVAVTHIHGHKKPGGGKAEAGFNNCAYEAAAVLAELLASKSHVTHPGMHKCEQRHVIAGNQLLLPHAIQSDSSGKVISGKFDLSRKCKCHSKNLGKQLEEEPTLAHYLTGQETLQLVEAFSSPSGAANVELLHRENAVRWLAAAIEAFWNGAHFDKTIDQGNSQRMHLACANIDPRATPGTHWVALRLSLSWKPKVNRLIHRQVRLPTPPAPTPPPTLPPRPVDAKLRMLFGTHIFHDADLDVRYSMTRIPISHALCCNQLQPDMELGPTNSLLLVWVLQNRGNLPVFVRHVIVGPSSVCVGQGLFLWRSDPKLGSKLGTYTGKESSLFATEALAQEYAYTTMLPQQRNYSLLRQRDGGWVVVDASESSAECFLSFVNDPSGARHYANTYFDCNAVLKLKSLIAVYDLSLSHESNRAAELLCRYRPDNDFFGASLPDMEVS